MIQSIEFEVAKNAFLASLSVLGISAILKTSLCRHNGLEKTITRHTIRILPSIVFYCNEPRQLNLGFSKVLNANCSINLWSTHLDNCSFFSTIHSTIQSTIHRTIYSTILSTIHSKIHSTIHSKIQVQSTVQFTVQSTIQSTVQFTVQSTV